MVDDIYEKKSTSDKGKYDNFEVVDVDVVKPDDVDLGLDDAPYEIGMDVLKKMDEDEEARKQALLNVQAETVVGKRTIYKDMMFTRFDNVIDAYQADKRRKKAAIATVITFICTMLPFWGIKIEGLTLMTMSNLFNGYGFYGIAGKAFVLCLVISLVLMSINLKKWAYRINTLGWVAFVAQVALIVVFGPLEYTDTTNNVTITIINLRPHVGTITTLIGQIVLTVLYSSISKHSTQQKQDKDTVKAKKPSKKKKA